MDNVIELRIKVDDYLNPETSSIPEIERSAERDTKSNADRDSGRKI